MTSLIRVPDGFDRDIRLLTSSMFTRRIVMGFLQVVRAIYFALLGYTAVEIGLLLSLATIVRRTLKQISQQATSGQITLMPCRARCLSSVGSGSGSIRTSRVPSPNTAAVGITPNITIRRKPAIRPTSTPNEHSVDLTKT